MALSQHPQQLQELPRRGDFDGKPKEDMFQLSKLLKAPTKLKELQVTCKFKIPCLLSITPARFSVPHQVLSSHASVPLHMLGSLPRILFPPLGICPENSPSCFRSQLHSPPSWKPSLQVPPWLSTCDIYRSLLISPIDVPGSPTNRELIQGKEKALLLFTPGAHAASATERFSTSVC